MQQTAGPLGVNKIPAAQRELGQAKGQRYPGPPCKEPMRPSSATDNSDSVLAKPCPTAPCRNEPRAGWVTLGELQRLPESPCPHANMQQQP